MVVFYSVAYWGRVDYTRSVTINSGDTTATARVPTPIGIRDVTVRLVYVSNGVKSGTTATGTIIE